MAIEYESFKKLDDKRYNKDFIFDGVDYFQAKFKLEEQYNCKLCGRTLTKNEDINPNSFNELEYTHWLEHKTLLSDLNQYYATYLQSYGDYIENCKILKADVYDLDENIMSEYEKYLTNTNKYKNINTFAKVTIIFFIISVVVGLAFLPFMHELFMGIKDGIGPADTSNMLPDAAAKLSPYKNLRGAMIDFFSFMATETMAFLITSFISNKIYNKIFTRLDGKEVKVTEDYRASVYTDKNNSIVTLTELEDIKEALNKAIDENDAAMFKRIIVNLKKSELEAFMLNKKRVENNLSKVNQKINKQKEKDNKRIKNNKVLSGVYSYSEVDDLFGALNYNNKALVKNFTKYELKDILKVKELLKSYEDRLSMLSAADKNRYLNCKDEFLSNYKKVQVFLESGVKLTEEFKSDFVKLSRLCLTLLNGVEDNILEASRNDVKVSTMFLEDKYEHLLKENK